MPSAFARIRSRSWVLSVATVVFLVVPRVASAQGVFESVGERALGMAGAFVAVADDATAPHWNPAGLVSGGPGGLTIGWQQFQVGNQAQPPALPGSRGATSFSSLGTWPLGISYGTFERTVLEAPGAGDPLEARRLRVRHVGVTILQSVFEGLVVGSTLKILRGETAQAVAEADTMEGALTTSALVPGDPQTRFDMDLGVMASAPRLRLGLTLRNLRSSSFRAMAGREEVLPRQARAGIAWLPADGLTLATDLDLNTVDLMGDLRRMCAVGAEARVGSKLLVRSGLRWNLATRSGPIGAIGASIGVRRGLWLDAHYSMSRHDEDREVGAALRAGF